MQFFTIPRPKVPLPDKKHECAGIIGPGIMKNRMRTTRGKLASPYLVFANLLELQAVQVVSSLDA